MPTPILTPTGQPGRLIECHCGTNHGTGTAIIQASWPNNPKLVHGLVTLAHDPVVSQAPKIRREGPWPA
jgi:hypothetical protein